MSRRDQRSLILFVVGLQVLCARAQIVEVHTSPPGEEAPPSELIQHLSKGLCDVYGSGLLDASAQLLRIDLGEEGTWFHIPIYILAGAADGGSTTSNRSDSAVTRLISQTAGTVNLFGNGEVCVPVFDPKESTQLYFTYCLGGRLVRASDVEPSDEISYLAGYAHAGLLFQMPATLFLTGEKGTFWAQVRYAMSFASQDDIDKTFGEGAESPAGVAIDAGVRIKNRINLKIGWLGLQRGDDLVDGSESLARIAVDFDLSGK